MSYSINDTRTKALIYNTLEQKFADSTFTNNYIKIISFDKTEEPYYNATVDVLMTEGDKVTKASIKISNNYVEFFDCKSTYKIILSKKIETNKVTYSIRFDNRNTANSSTTITTNTQVRKGIMALETIALISDTNNFNDILTIEPNYARALPDNYLTSVSGLTVSIENNNLIIS